MTFVAANDCQELPERLAPCFEYHPLLREPEDFGRTPTYLISSRVRCMTLTASSNEDIRSQETTSDLVAENKRLRQEISLLKQKLERLQDPLSAEEPFLNAQSHPISTCTEPSATHTSVPWQGNGHNLSKDNVERYSRQILLSCMGVQGRLPFSPLSTGSFICAVSRLLFNCVL